MAKPGCYTLKTLPSFQRAVVCRAKWQGGVLWLVREAWIEATDGMACPMIFDAVCNTFSNCFLSEEVELPYQTVMENTRTLSTVAL